jgi:molybdopterin-guanine dinucleotide biosynthesis protein A
MWTGVILAGGQARRLGGRNKASLMLGATTVLERQLDRLRHATQDVIIVASDRQAYRSANVRVVEDLRPGDGALGALYTAIHESGTDRTLIVACDMPFISVDFLGYLMSAGRDVDIAIPRTARGYEPLCATYSRGSADGILRLLEENRFKLADVATIPGLNVREIRQAELAPFGPEDTLFFNINTPEDYARAIDMDGEYRTRIG